MPRYNDFRELCGRPDIDAVCIASPDHWHVLHSLEAVRNGKDIYTEKALGLSLTADKALRAACPDGFRIFELRSTAVTCRPLAKSYISWPAPVGSWAIHPALSSAR